MTPTRRKLLLTFVVAIGIAVVPGSALAASGQTTISLRGSGLKSLKSQKVKLSAGKPAKLKGSKLTLPNTGGLVGDSATVLQGGTLKLKRGKRTVKISSIRLSFGGKSQARLYGRLGGKQLAVFTIKTKPSAMTLNRVVGAAKLSSGSLSLSKSAAKAIRKKLKLRRALKRSFGSIATEALLGTTVGSDTRPAGCWTSLARPITAVDITSATINWHVRPEWVNYLNSGPAGSGAFAVAPASATGTYDFQMGAPYSGWYDPASGKASVLGSGGVQFSYPTHGIDIRTVSPLVEIDGACSRATFVYNDGQRRGVVDLAGAAPSAAGSTFTYNALPGAMSGEATPYFTYPAGTSFGSMTVSVTTP